MQRSPSLSALDIPAALYVARDECGTPRAEATMRGLSHA
jgi:hypothetical protein